MLLGLLLTVAHAQDDPDVCDDRFAPGEVDQALDAAEEAFAAGDEDGFAAAGDEAREALRCVNARMPTSTAARFHRVEGLRAHLEERDDVARAFAAARALDFAYTFPPELVPADSPILEHWSAMDLSDGTLQTMPAPHIGALWIDGIETPERPVGWPALVQLVDPGGGPVFSRYLHHDEDAPDYLTAAQVAAAPPTSEAPDRRALQPRVPLLIGAGTAAVATGVLVAVSGTSRAAFFDDDTPPDELRDLRRRTNTTAVASAVTGLTAVGLGVGVALTW